jgi:hypothetical protein
MIKEENSQANLGETEGNDQEFLDSLTIALGLVQKEE